MAKQKPMPTQETILELLHYTPETGEFRWRKRPRSYFGTDVAWKKWNTRFTGKPALCTLAHNGYLYGAIFGENFSTHRVAWLYVHGEEPIEVDHINGDREDNRIVNLRNVSRKENCKNAAVQRNSVSGHKGLWWDKKFGKWHVRISTEYLGRFDSFEKALSVRKEAEEKRGYHPNHGRKAALKGN